MQNLAKPNVVKKGLSFFFQFLKNPNRFTVPETLQKRTVIHYLKNKVGVVDFANAEGLVMF